MLNSKQKLTKHSLNQIHNLFLHVPVTAAPCITQLEFFRTSVDEQNYIKRQIYNKTEMSGIREDEEIILQMDHPLLFGNQKYFQTTALDLAQVLLTKN